MRTEGISSAQTTTFQPLAAFSDQPSVQEVRPQTARGCSVPWGPDAGTVQIESLLGGAGDPSSDKLTLAPDGRLPYPTQTPPFCQQIMNYMMQLIQMLVAMLGGRQAKPRQGRQRESTAGTDTTTKTPANKLENIGGRQAVRVDGQDGFLWKPISDGGNKKLVVLLPKDVTQNAKSCVIRDANGNVVGRANQSGDFNGRGIFRFAKEGGAYPHNCTVEVQLQDGTTKRYPIGDTSLRHD